MNRCDNEEICNEVKDKGAFYRASTVIIKDTTNTAISP